MCGLKRGEYRDHECVTFLRRTSSLRNGSLLPISLCCPFFPFQLRPPNLPSPFFTHAWLLLLHPPPFPLPLTCRFLPFRLPPPMSRRTSAHFAGAGACPPPRVCLSSSFQPHAASLPSAARLEADPAPPPTAASTLTPMIVQECKRLPNVCPGVPSRPSPSSTVLLLLAAVLPHVSD